MALQVGDRAPEFSAIADNGATIRSTDYLGKSVVVLYFYPMDQTPGCTAQACAFRDAYADFTTAGAVVLGVSSDSVASHERFVQNRQLPFRLLSDAQGELRKVFQVPKTWAIFPGRVTYVIDRAGVIRSIFNSQFNATAHIAEALKMVRELAANPSK